MTFIGKKICQKIKNKNFQPRLMKLCNLVAYKFLTKNVNFGVNQCISGNVVSQNMEFIRLAISQPFLTIETSGLNLALPKRYDTLKCKY